MNKYTPEQLDKIFLQIKEFVTTPDYKIRILDLRNYIDEVYPREADTIKNDFAEIKSCFVRLNKRVNDINMCLGIDFKLDDLKPVNYDFIKDDLIRDKANAYYREMLRYQFGTRNHKICFGEFCRLATIQIEFMLNYFFTDENHSELLKEELIKTAKKKFNKAHEKRENNPSRNQTEPILTDFENEESRNLDEYIPDIYLSTKSKIFYENFLNKVKIGNNGISFVSKWTVNMRNRKSHGSKTTIEPNEESYLSDKEMDILDNWRNKVKNLVDNYNKGKNNKIRFSNDMLYPGELGWDNVPEIIKSAFNKNSELRWISRKPFDEVHQLLNTVAGTCAKYIKN